MPMAIKGRKAPTRIKANDTPIALERLKTISSEALSGPGTIPSSTTEIDRIHKLTISLFPDNSP